MKHKNKLIGGIIIIALLAIPFYFYEKYQGGIYYYTQITKDPIKTEDALNDAGVKQGAVYTYELVGYDDKGTQKQLEFDAYKDKPLRKDAYLKVKVNEVKGVLNWEEVKQNDLPSKVKSKLN